MVIVDCLNERLDLASLFNSLRAHALGHLQRIANNASYNCVGEFFVL